MARPWQSKLLSGALQELLQHQVGLVINLQEVGEHAHCGPGILPASGFSYLPETLMAQGIRFCHAAWPDMGVPSLATMLRIAHVMHHTTTSERRKVAVHCHSGLGRTGLVLACYSVYSSGASPQNAVATVRRGRPGALQTHEQELFVRVFDCFLQHLRCVYSASSAVPTSQAPTPARAHLWNNQFRTVRGLRPQALVSFTPAPPASLQNMAARQKLLLAGAQLQHYWNVSWVLVELLRVCITAMFSLHSFHLVCKT